MNKRTDANPDQSQDRDDPNFTSSAGFSFGRLLIGLPGAIAGGALGYFVYKWALSQGFYALVIPGAFLGFGFGLAARRSHWVFGILCFVLAFGLSLFAEWSTWPFKADGSWWYFLTHLDQLKPLTWVMIGVGSLIAFTLGRGRG